MNENFLHFDPALHRYTVSNRILPSVTSIIKPLQNFANIDEKTLEYARQKGVAIHAAIKLHNENKLDIMSVDLAIVNRFEAWLSFLKDKTPDIVGFETPMYSQIYDYAGTPDLWIRMNDEIWLIDIKPNTYFKWYAIQLAGYQQLLKETLDLIGLRRATLQVTDEGKYKFTPYKRNEDANDMNTFISCLRLFQWRKQNDN